MPCWAKTDAMARPIVACARYAGMTTLTSTAIDHPRTAPAMDDDAHTLRLWNDLGLAHIDDGAQNPRIGQCQGGHLLRKGLHEVDMPLGRRPLYQLVDQVRIGDVIANIVRAWCSRIGD